MQLKLSRSQRQGGILSKSAIFCLDARAQLTAREVTEVSRYKLGSQVIYNSEAAKRQLTKSEAVADGSFTGSLKQMGYAALAAMNLNITIDSLQRGQHIECKDLNELLGAEDAIMAACERLKGFLETASTFDGREMVIDLSTGTPALASAPALPVSRSSGTLEPPPDAIVMNQSAAAMTMDATALDYGEVAAAGPDVFQNLLDWINRRSIMEKLLLLVGLVGSVYYLFHHL
jgi:hypothetical protein